MELQVSPDIDDLKLILWLAGGLIMGMIAVISYFIRQQFEASVLRVPAGASGYDIVPWTNTAIFSSVTYDL